jgi:hypothetical protein
VDRNKPDGISFRHLSQNVDEQAESHSRNANGLLSLGAFWQDRNCLTFFISNIP